MRGIIRERRLDQFGWSGELHEDRVKRWERQDITGVLDRSVWGRMFNRMSGTVENLYEGEEGAEARWERHVSNVSHSSVSSVGVGASLSRYFRSKEVKSQSSTTSSLRGMNTLLVKLLTANLHLTGSGREEDRRVWSPAVRSDPVRAILTAS